MQITKTSPLTGKTNTMEIDVTQEQLDCWARGVDLIQNIMPDLTPAEREFLISGRTQEDWDEMFPPEKEANQIVDLRVGDHGAEPLSDEEIQ